MVFVYSFWLLMIGNVTAATLKGQAPERAAAIAFLVAAVLSIAARSGGPSTWYDLEVGVLMVDGALLGLLLWLALRTGRRWLIWAAAFQTISVMSHVDWLLDLELKRYGYALMAGFSGPATQILLAIAIWRHPSKMVAGNT